jgi:hypothetical protein
MDQIGINWKPIWKDVWDPVWATEIIIPEIPETPAVHGRGMERYKEALRQQAVGIDDEEILLILSEAIGVID